MGKYNHAWITFLSGRNVIKVTNENEFNTFKKFLEKCGLLYILKDDLEYKDWQHLAEINNKNTNIFLFEYHNEKGITWWDNIKEAEDWYGEKPIEINELNEFLDIKNMEQKEDTKAKRLCDLVEIEENNMDCILFKVKENSELDLIKLGCFEGNEKMIRVSKGKDHTFTIFTDKSHYSWYYGESGYTLVSKDMDKKRLLIMDCIEIDFDIYIGKNKDLVRKTLDIQSLKDTYNKIDDVKIMYWKRDKDNDVCVHKNGEYFRHFAGIDVAKETLKKYGYDLNLKRDHIAQTGCIVEEYSMIKRNKNIEKNNQNNLEKDNENDYDYN